MGHCDDDRSNKHDTGWRAESDFGWGEGGRRRDASGCFRMSEPSLLVTHFAGPDASCLPILHDRHLPLQQPVATKSRIGLRSTARSRASGHSRKAWNKGKLIGRKGAAQTPGHQGHPHPSAERPRRARPRYVQPRDRQQDPRRRPCRRAGSRRGARKPGDLTRDGVPALLRKRPPTEDLGSKQLSSYQC